MKTKREGREKIYVRNTIISERDGGKGEKLLECYGGRK
jgi:hypothetical protein